MEDQELSEELQGRSHTGSMASSSDGENLISRELSSDFDDDTALQSSPSDGITSDSELAVDVDDFAYYQDVYRFVGIMKDEFEKRKPKVDWDTIQRKRSEVHETLITKQKEVAEAVQMSRERIRMKGREKMESGKERLRRLKKRTYKRLKKLEPEENYRMKIVFTKSVLTLVLKTFAVCSGQWLLPWYYAFTCPMLIIWRIYTYWQNQWQYFCLDFCYFGNLIISLILWFKPSSPELCLLQFSIANGMLYLGAFSFRNSLVFHSVDKMTSTYIHTVPVLLTFGIRWFPEESSRFWHDRFPSYEDVLQPSWQWSVLAPFIVLLVHTIIYAILVNGILKPEEHIITSFRYMKAKSSVKKIFGPEPPYMVFVLVNMVLCLIFSSLTMVFYQSFTAHVTGICILFFYITWNGAGYYVDIFRMSMGAKKKDE